MAAGIASAIFMTLFVAHQVADHWVQTEWQANTKGLPGWVGRRACAGHVATYTITALICVQVAVSALDMHLSGWRIAIGLAVSAVTHYIADRRTPLKVMARWAGHREFHELGVPRPDHDDNPSLGTGKYALDQSYHVFWLFVAALVIAA